MAKEDYVDFETTKLLEEKGFDWPESPFYSEQDRDEWRQNNSYTIPNEKYNPEIPFDSEILIKIAPHVSLQTAMKWLRKVHNIAIDIIYIERECSWYAYVKPMTPKPYKGDYYWCKSVKYEKVCETAIKYYLKNLI